jgi:hypothetical protein
VTAATEDLLLLELLVVIPDVLPSYALQLFRRWENTNIDGFGARVQHAADILLSSTNPYPRIPKTDEEKNKNKNKRKREAAGRGDCAHHWLDVENRKHPGAEYRKEAYASRFLLF